MEQVRYRTEAFSGSQEREAVKVLTYETFELENTDILVHLRDHLLKDSSLINQCNAFIEELEGTCASSDVSAEQIKSFFRTVLNSIEKECGVSVKYVLWLADKEAVTDREWYGRDMDSDDNFECFEIGPVIFTDLGYDGTLYGYPELPISLEDQIEDLRCQIADVINESECSRLSAKRAAQLDNMYVDLNNKIQEIDAILSQKVA